MLDLARSSRLTSTEIDAVLNDLQKNGSVSEEQALISPSRKKSPTKDSTATKKMKRQQQQEGRRQQRQQREDEYVSERAYVKRGRQTTRRSVKSPTVTSTKTTSSKRKPTSTDKNKYVLMQTNYEPTRNSQLHSSIQTSPIRTNDGEQAASITAYRERRRAAKRVADRSRKERAERERELLVEEEERLRRQRNAELETKATIEARKRAQERSARKRANDVQKERRRQAEAEAAEAETIRIAAEQRAQKRAARAGPSPYRQHTRARSQASGKKRPPNKPAAKTGEWMGMNITLDDYDGDMDIAAFGVRRSNGGNINFAINEEAEMTESPFDTPRLRKELIKEDDRNARRSVRVAKATETRTSVHKGALAFANHPVIPKNSNVSGLADELSAIGWQGQKLYDELVSINDAAERDAEVNRRRHRDAASEVNEIASFNLGDYGELVIKEGSETIGLAQQNHHHHHQQQQQQQQHQQQTTTHFTFANEEIQRSMRTKRSSASAARPYQDLSPLSRFVQERKSYGNAPPPKAGVIIKRNVANAGDGLRRNVPAQGSYSARVRGKQRAVSDAPPVRRSNRGLTDPRYGRVSKSYDTGAQGWGAAAVPDKGSWITDNMVKQTAPSRPLVFARDSHHPPMRVVKRGAVRII